MNTSGSFPNTYYEDFTIFSINLKDAIPEENFSQEFFFFFYNVVSEKSGIWNDTMNLNFTDTLSHDACLCPRYWWYYKISCSTRNTEARNAWLEYRKNKDFDA